MPDDEHGFSRYVIAGLRPRDERVVELRPFGVFGPYEDYAIRFISNAICKTLFDLPVTLRQDGASATSGWTTCAGPGALPRGGVRRPRVQRGP